MGYSRGMDSRGLDRDDANWNFRARHETETQRLDRNWSGLLQELRVVQTGVQLLTGFLLTLPFQQRFEDLSDSEVAIYLATVALSVTSTMLLVALPACTACSSVGTRSRISSLPPIASRSAASPPSRWR